MYGHVRARRRASRRIIAMIQLGSLLVLVSFILLVLPAIGDAEKSCLPSPPVPQTTQGRGQPPSINSSKDPIPIEVGRSRSTTHTRQVSLDVKGTLPINVKTLAVGMSDFARGDGLTLERKYLTPKAEVSGNRQSVTIFLCVDPRLDGNQEPHAGKYVGTVFLDDQRAKGGAATFTIRIKFASLPVTLAAAVIGAFVGFGGAILSAYVKADRSFRDINPGRWAATLALALFAGLAVWVSLYVNDPTYQGDLAQQLALATACGTAAYTAASALPDLAAVVAP